MVKKAPGWGKTVGILMITFGSFGVFYQIYRMVVPRLMSFQRKMIDRFSQIPEYMEYSDSTMTKEEFQEIVDYPVQAFEEVNNMFFNFSDAMINYLTWFSLLMILVCVFYIVAGSKLLKPTPSNYKMARLVLLISIGVNLLSYVLIFSEQGSFMLQVMMLYSFIGVAADVVFLIIMSSSDKSAYFNEEKVIIKSDDFDL